MNTQRLIVIVAAVTLLALSGEVRADSIINGGFESGLNGWTATVPFGGSATTNSSHALGGGLTVTPFAGDSFAQLKADGPGSFTKISQTVSLLAGDTVSGQARWYDAELAFGFGAFFNDTVQLNVLNGAGSVIATPFFDSHANNIAQFGNSPGNALSPWTPWNFVAPEAGLYTFEYEIANGGDSAVDSYAYLDAVVSTGGAPEVQAGGLFVLFAGPTGFPNPDPSQLPNAGLLFVGNQPGGTFPFVQFNGPEGFDLGGFNPLGEYWVFGGGTFPGFSPHMYTGVALGEPVPDIDQDIQAAIVQGIAVIEAGGAAELNAFFPGGVFSEPGDFLNVPLEVLIDFFASFGPYAPGSPEEFDFQQRMQGTFLDGMYSVLIEEGGQEDVHAQDPQFAIEFVIDGVQVTQNPDGTTTYGVAGVAAKPLPEPGSILLVAGGIVGIVVRRRRRRAE